MNDIEIVQQARANEALAKTAYTADCFDLTDDILKALRWIKDNASLYGAVSYEAFLAQGLHKGSSECTKGYTVNLPQGSVRVCVPEGTVGITMSLTQAGHMILDVVDRLTGRL